VTENFSADPPSGSAFVYYNINKPRGKRFTHHARWALRALRSGPGSGLASLAVLTSCVAHSEALMKKIVLLEPRSPDYHVFSRYRLPRMGLLILGAILERAGYYVKVFVEDMDDIDFKAVFEADLVGISTITSTAPRAYALATQIREHGIPVILGGPHVTFLTDEALQYADYVMRGEAEASIVPFVKALESGEGLGDVPGLSFRVGNTFYHNPVGPACQDLDTLPMPDFSLIRTPLRQVRPVMTSRGCPFDCSFCSVTAMFGRHYRFRSKENVLRELRSIDPKQIVFFYDDHFAANRQRTKELLEMMIEENITPRWTAQVRVDITRDRELMELFRRANCMYVYVGIESVNPDSLKAYNKKITVEEIEQAITVFHEYGIRVHGMFVLGCDEDTIETVRETAKFAKRNAIDTVQFMMLTPLPGSRQYYSLVEEKRLLTRDWGLYDALHIVFEPKNMTPLELQVETLKAMRSFYSIGQILKGLSKLDLIGVLLKSYAHRLQTGWEARNRGYYEIVKQMTTETADKMNLTWERTKEDIHRRIQNFIQKNEHLVKRADFLRIKNKALRIKDES
jgi:radical SAM superfamily enzyme YgiQ (UPF0313 family)